MANFLDTMARASRERCERARAERPAARLEALASSASLPPGLSLGAFDVIAEIKASSPSEGALTASADIDRPALAQRYAEGGAAAVSVLTEPTRFAGELPHLAAVAARLGADGPPAMRKDFLVDAYQVLEARVAGAGGVLLIAAMLDDDALAGMLDAALDLGLFVLLECFDEADVSRCRVLRERSRYGDAGESGALLIGVNTRDLRTLAVDTGRLAELAPHLPAGARRVAESGLAVPADAARAAELGYSVALIGTALMRADDPGGLVSQFVASGRSARG